MHVTRLAGGPARRFVSEIARAANGGPARRLNGEMGFTIIFAVVLLLAQPTPANAETSGASEWAHLGPDGKLVYGTTPRGDRIMDFSFAGYMAGGVALPAVPAVETVKPSDSDAAAEIQKAIDAVSQLPLQNGFRGAVELGPGTYLCGNTITLRADGVVLRGSGAEKTILSATGKPHLCLSIEGEAELKKQGKPIPVVDEYVPSGSNVIHLLDASSLKVGDAIVVNHPVTTQWIHFMGMDALERNGKNEKWLTPTTVLQSQLHVSAIDGNKVTLDIPLTDDLDSKFTTPPGASIQKADVVGQVTQIGIEDLGILAPKEVIKLGEASFGGIQMRGAADSWVRNVSIDNTIGAVGIGAGCARIAVQGVKIHHDVSVTSSAKPADFAIDGTQVFIDRCNGDGNNVFYLATMARVIGPSVILNCNFKGNGAIQPHMRWATGLLIDNCQCPEGGIDLMNRGIMGSGHGWTIGWSVAWNCEGRTFLIQQPPGSANWAIGCRGKMETAATPGGSKEILPAGIVDSPDHPVAPHSLYLQQLEDRLGIAAVHNIGY
jgi:hypothetical protein